MIGGSDIVFPAIGDCTSLEACVRLVSRFWPSVRLEDAITGDKFTRIGDVPFERVRELLLYADSNAEASWDADRDDSPENSMLYLIVRPQDITVVVDNPRTLEMQSILNAIREMLCSHVTSS